MEYVVNTILAGSIAICVEVPVGVVRAGVDSETDVVDLLMRVWGGLGAADRGAVVRTTLGELVVVSSKGSKPGGLNLKAMLDLRSAFESEDRMPLW